MREGDADLVQRRDETDGCLPHSPQNFLAEWRRLSTFPANERQPGPTLAAELLPDEILEATGGAPHHDHLTGKMAWVPERP
jgi:hypothetical protein